jgi:hypothetical protein
MQTSLLFLSLGCAANSPVCPKLSVVAEIRAFYYGALPLIPVIPVLTNAVNCDFINFLNIDIVIDVVFDF